MNNVPFLRATVNGERRCLKAKSIWELRSMQVAAIRRGYDGGGPMRNAALQTQDWPSSNFPNRGREFLVVPPPSQRAGLGGTDAPAPRPPGQYRSVA